MAALSDSPLTRLVDLRQLRPGDLDPLLAEETDIWRDTLDWDFRGSAGLVRRFLDMQALNGCALLMNERPVGYCYFVAEERKGLIGDLYVMKEFDTVEVEERLLTTVVDGLIRTMAVHRIESQLMMLRNAASIRLPQKRHVRAHGRNFMQAELAVAGEIARGSSGSPGLDRQLERAQAGRSRGLDRQRLSGTHRQPDQRPIPLPTGRQAFPAQHHSVPRLWEFFQPASFVAVEPGSGRLCGMCLSSLVKEDVGHITQVCVSKSVRRWGVGYELIRRSLESLAGHGCRRVSLTVTATNTEAIAVYERMGFHKSRNFLAFVWEGF